MSHVTHVNESCHVTHVNESCVMLSICWWVMYICINTYISIYIYTSQEVNGQPMIVIKVPDKAKADNMIGKWKHTRTHTHTHTHTHSCTHASTHTLTYPTRARRTVWLASRNTHTHTQTHTNTHTRTRTHTYTLSLSLSLSHTHIDVPDKGKPDNKIGK